MSFNDIFKKRFMKKLNIFRHFKDGGVVLLNFTLKGAPQANTFACLPCIFRFLNPMNIMLDQLNTKTERTLFAKICHYQI